MLQEGAVGRFCLQDCSKAVLDPMIGLLKFKCIITFNHEHFIILYKIITKGMVVQCLKRAIKIVFYNIYIYRCFSICGSYQSTEHNRVDAVVSKLSKTTH